MNSWIYVLNILFPYHLIGQLNNGIFNRPIMGHTEILEHSQGPQGTQADHRTNYFPLVFMVWIF